MEIKPAEGGKLGRELRQLPTPDALKTIPEIMARRYNAIPVRLTGNTLEMAMANPSDILALEALTAYSKRRIKALPADERELREAIDFNYKGYGEVDRFLSRMSVSADMTDEKPGHGRRRGRPAGPGFEPHHRRSGQGPRLRYPPGT